MRRYAGEMHISADKVDIALESLRTSSVERIAARNSFLLTGIAALKVKVAASKTHGSKNVSREPFVVNTKLDVKGSQLRTLIAEHCKVNVNDIKMISSGRIVTDDPLLTEQGIAVSLIEISFLV